MDLYIIRHAEAVPRGTADVNGDEDRPLTDRGHAQARALSAALQRQGALDVLLTSPLLRAPPDRGGSAGRLARPEAGAAPVR